MKIFVSYSRRDIEKAQIVHDALQNAGHDVWRDMSNIPGGGSWDVEIEQALRRADVVIVLMSHPARESTWVRIETGFARSLNKQVIPLMLEPTESFVHLFDVHYIELYPNIQRGIAALLDQLGEVKNEPREAETTIIEQTEQTIGNPFIFGNAIAAEQFIGRTDIIKAIKLRVASSSLQSLSIVANSKMGKSSLINYLRKNYQAILPPNRQWVIVYINASAGNARTPETMMRTLRKGIAAQIGSDPWPENSDGQLDVLTTEFENLWKRGVELILCLDEWESAMTHPDLTGIVETLRVSGNQSHISMITTTVREHSELVRPDSVTSPFHNIFQVAYMGMMPQKEWVNLIEQAYRRSNVTMPDASIRMIGALAGGHPYLTQLAGWLMWEAQENQWTKREFKQRFHQDADEKIFLPLIHRLSTEQRATLRRLLGQPNAKGYKSALEQLKNRGVVTAKDTIFCKPFERMLYKHLIENNSTD